MKKILKHLSKKELVLLVIAMMIIVSSISYAFYLAVVSQEGENEISSACFRLTMEENDEIGLEKTYPLSEAEGSELRPFKFTIKNICNKAANYQVNIETLNESTLETEYIRYKLDEKESKILGEEEEVRTYVNNEAKESRKISEGILLKNESKTYNLRLWLDEEAEARETSEKTYVSKVVVISELNKNPNVEIAINTNGGYLEQSVIEAIERKELGNIPEPERVGYVFLGWFKDEELTQGVASDTIVDKELTNIYASWTKGRYELEVELDGGTYNSSAKTITWTGTYNPSTNRITWSDNTTTNLSAQIGTTNTITVTKNVSLVFADIDLTETSMTNEVEGRITLANGAELDAEDDLTTTIYFKRNIIVNKVWRGDTGANTRPETIRIQIKNGNTLVEQHTINSSMNWTDTFTNLPKYDTTTGNEITYTITENPVPSGYYVNIAEDTSAGAIASKTTPNDLVYTVTNSKYGSIHITKVDKADNTIKLGGAELRLSKLKYENNEWVVDNTFSPVTQITSSANATLGETTFSNLEYGKYRLEETVAPTGYNLLRSAVDIDVTEALPDYSANVENLHKTVLPATGGEYKVIIAIAGIAMIMTAVHINNKKKLKARMK